MKKFMVMVAAVMMFSAAAKAEENVNEGQVSPFVVDSVNYTFRIHLADLEKVMKLKPKQMEAMQFSNRELTRRIATLQEVAPEYRRRELYRILSENLTAVHEVVNDAQYRSYLAVVNEEFRKAGLTSILYGFDMMAAK